jgi:hypothetical protein
MGLVVAASDVSVRGCRIDATSPNDLGMFGDGVMVASHPHPASVVLDATRVSGSSRAGLANFGASASLGTSLFECGGLALDGEVWFGAAFAFEDRGNNGCGCPSADSPCSVISAGLEPPAPVEPVEPTE